MRFANGCVANVTASRASPDPQRTMRIWSPEGYARVDFGARRAKLIQPSDRLRRHGLDPSKLDPASRALLKDELFGRHLQVYERDCRDGHDQLTRELTHFIHCVQTGSRPRVNGEDARDAVELATCILDSIRSHSWEGQAGGATGPSRLPSPHGMLFQPQADDLAA